METLPNSLPRGVTQSGQAHTGTGIGESRRLLPGRSVDYKTNQSGPGRNGREGGCKWHEHRFPMAGLGQIASSDCSTGFVFPYKLVDY